MTGAIQITTGARLHFGLLSHRPACGREFGGAGLMIDSPSFRITAEPHSSDSVHGPAEAAARTRRFVAAYRDNAPHDLQPPPCAIRIHETIPPHCGLGSGTQLGLAVARAMSALAPASRRREPTGAYPKADATASAGGSLPSIPATLSCPTLARWVGRGARSALGIHGFRHGGFLIDGGKDSQDGGEEVPPAGDRARRFAAGLAPRSGGASCHSGRQAIGTLVARAEFPSQWRMILVTPAGAQGLAGRRECAAFERLRGMPPATTDRLCRIALMGLLPAVIDGDFSACSEALSEFGRKVGEYFAPVQGGTYASPPMRALVEHLYRQGIAGVGQTSWGPTVFILQPDHERAQHMLRSLSADSRWSDCRFRLARPKNNGAAAGAESRKHGAGFAAIPFD